MIVRAIDTQNDWTYGRGFQDYKSGNIAVAQNIKTRLQSFLNDCFFAKSVGIDWFNLLGGKSQLALQLAISSTIANTNFVSKVLQLSIELDSSRELLVQYSVTTSFGATINESLPFVPVDYLLTQDGNILTTEDGTEIHL